ncbi:hypothetical protein [Pseudoalteromonas sp. T1lg76]|uniref:hypothetical protein n=1 Tax=Pseudoalteromonas sp. T1lg76 TaxID=2077103 RepID=UPI000CF71403|nr:hypothetical protein [Pseudoalteromonas sp. T1lg76]
MANRGSDKLAQWQQQQKQQSALQAQEKKALLSALDSSPRNCRSWWHQGQWLMACVALLTLVSVTWQAAKQEHAPLYSVESYTRMEIFDLAGGEQRMRISDTVPAQLRSIDQAELQLANQLRVQHQAYALGSETEPVRLVRLVQNKGDWLLADCRQQVLIALSSELLKRVEHPGVKLQSGTLLALSFDSNGQLVAIQGAGKHQQC